MVQDSEDRVGWPLRIRIRSKHDLPMDNPVEHKHLECGCREEETGNRERPGSESMSCFTRGGTASFFIHSGVLGHLISIPNLFIDRCRGQAFILHFPELRALLYCCRATLASDRFSDVVYDVASRGDRSASAVSNVRRQIHQALTDILSVVDRLLVTTGNRIRDNPKCKVKA